MKTEQKSTEAVSADRRVETRRSKGANGPQLRIAAASLRPEALRAIAHDWLVPRLVQVFLQEQGVLLRDQKNSPVLARNKHHAASVKKQ